MKAMVLGSPPGADGIAERLVAAAEQLGEKIERPHCTMSVLLTDESRQNVSVTVATSTAGPPLTWRWTLNETARGGRTHETTIAGDVE